MKHVNLLHNNYNRIGLVDVTFQNKHCSLRDCDTVTGFQGPFDRLEINHKSQRLGGLLIYILYKPTAVIMTIHWLPLVEKEILTADSLSEPLSVSLSVSETMSHLSLCTRRESRVLSVSALRSFRNQSVRPFATKLLNFASFGHSLRNIQYIYSQNIMYRPIQSRTIRVKMPDESTCESRIF